jgi:hypothetical protein
VVYLVAAWRQGQGRHALWGGGARIAIPAGLLLVPWAAKSWILTGNPVYPFLYRWFGGGEWSPELGSRVSDWQQGIGMGRSALDYLLLPYRVIVAGGPGYDSFDGRISPLWLGLLPLAVVLGWRQPLVTRSLGAAALYFGLWALSSQQMRFLIPILPLLALAAALGMAEAARRLPERARSWFRISVSLAAAAMLLVVSSTTIVPTGRMLGEYFERGAALREEVVHPVYTFIDDRLPAEAKLLFLNTNHGFFCHREFVADSFFEASQINELLQTREGKAGVRAALAELGITHLLIENRDRYVPWPRSLYDFLNDSAMTRQIYRSPDNVYDVVEILPRSASP